MTEQEQDISAPTPDGPGPGIEPPKIFHRVLEEMGAVQAALPPKGGSNIPAPPRELPPDRPIPHVSQDMDDLTVSNLPSADERPIRKSQSFPVIWMILTILLSVIVLLLLWDRYRQVAVEFIPEFAPERAVQPPLPPPAETTVDPVVATDQTPDKLFTIPKLVLTRRVTAFGQYDPLPDTPIQARHVPHILAYAEVLNPLPEPREDGRFIYYLTQSTLLFRTDIGPSEPLMDSAVSSVIGGLSPRRDFHVSQSLQAGHRITPGEYTVRVQVTDQISGQTATRETMFTVQPD